MIATATHPVWSGAMGSLGAGLCTGLGALPVLLLARSLRPGAEAAMLGFSAGVMLAATSFSLLVPALAAAAALGHGPFGSASTVGAGMLLGALALLAMHRAVPHEHFKKGREGAIAAPQAARLWLFVAAITLHNLPEGLAVGVGFGSDPDRGLSLAIGMGLQNVPEGLAVALALRKIGHPGGRAFLVALATGLVEPVGGVLGAAAVGFGAGLLPWGMAFAAGAMLFVISGEIIPETHREGQGMAATWGLMVGFVVMMVLDTALQ